MGVVNVIKFFVLELLVSIVLEPAWELIISRVAHYRIIRGHRVPLASIAHSRTFPCALSIGGVSTAVAIALSFTVLGGSFASEYAVDVIAKPVPHEGNTTVYARRLGRAADSGLLQQSPNSNFKDASQNISATVSTMVERCFYYDDKTNRYFVNASFETSGNQESPCVENDPQMTYQVPAVCTLTAKQAHDYYCVWNPTTKKLEATRDFPQSFDQNWYRELYANNKSIQLHKCELSTCEKQNVISSTGGDITANLYCRRRNTDGLDGCVYVSDRWVVLSRFNPSTGIPSRQIDAVLVYRNSRGKQAFEPMSPIDIRVIEYFQSSFDGHPEYTTFDLGREHDGFVIMLMLEGFGRPQDLVSIQDYRKDKSELFTTIDLKLLIPLIVATVLLVVGALISLVLTPKRNMVLQPPVSIEQAFACARAREEPGSDTSWGAKEKLDMGIVHDEHGTQRFSVRAENTVKYEPGLRWSHEPADDKITSM